MTEIWLGCRSPKVVMSGMKCSWQRLTLGPLHGPDLGQHCLTSLGKVLHGWREKLPPYHGVWKPKNFAVQEGVLQGITTQPWAFVELAPDSIQGCIRKGFALQLRNVTSLPCSAVLRNQLPQRAVAQYERGTVILVQVQQRASEPMR